MDHESINIWTHGLGTLWFLSRVNKNRDRILFVTATTGCLGSSSLYHWLGKRRNYHQNELYVLDMLGIANMVVVMDGLILNRIGKWNGCSGLVLGVFASDILRFFMSYRGTTDNIHSGVIKRLLLLISVSSLFLWKTNKKAEILKALLLYGMGFLVYSSNLPNSHELWHLFVLYGAHRLEKLLFN